MRRNIVRKIAKLRLSKRFSVFTDSQFCDECNTIGMTE